MVFFTCNSCGQCVKKANVEKHYLTECRSCEVLSCMDCGKDFAGDDYKHHTKCVSENEKYGGKEYRANAKPNKGEVKQSQWIESVQSASSSQPVNPRVRGLLNRLADYNNIPRKKAKFERFIQNSLKVWNADLIEQVWAVFSEAGNKQKAQPEQKARDESGKNEDKQIPEKGLQELGGQLEKDSIKGSKKKREDKHHHHHHLGGGNGCAKEEGGTEDGELPKKKKKKKHKEGHVGNSQDVSKDEQKNVGTSDAERTVDNGVQKDEAGLSKKKKKKKDKVRHVGTSEDVLKDEDKNGEASSTERTVSSGVELDETGLLKEKKRKKHKKSPTKEAKDFMESKGKREETREEDERSSKETKSRKQYTEKESKKRHFKDASKGGVDSEHPTSDADRDDAGLKNETERKSSVDQMTGKKKKRQMKEENRDQDAIGDETAESGKDGLLSSSRKKEKKLRHASSEAVGMSKISGSSAEEHMDGEPCVQEKKKKKVKKHKDTCADLKSDGASESFAKSEVEKSMDGLLCVSKMEKTTHTDRRSDHRNDASKESKKRKQRSEDVSTDLKESDTVKIKKKEKDKCKQEDSNLKGSGEQEMQTNVEDEKRKSEDCPVTSKTKKQKKRKLEGESSKAIQTDEASDQKKKKKSKVVDNEKENGHQKKQEKSLK